MLANDVKLVVWDLDDTFWSGTLSEGEIEFDARNISIITDLAKRGIISSVVSKNDHPAAEGKLRECGSWDYFVMPRIQFGPKGPAIAQLLEDLGLRAENTLFIDDNRLNLQEAQHYAPGIMVADPEILPELLNMPQLKGKDDSKLTRLAQYKNIETKIATRTQSTLSNEEFLRESEIRVSIDYEIEQQMDRVLELANRTNQLNFTKKRLETPEAITEFKELLGLYGYSAGFVSASDRYGDYGIVGFFLQRRNAMVNTLVHFVFSCRAMNMGVEQYVWEKLGRPTIKIVEPVSNPIEVFDNIDWISDSASTASPPLNKKLLLIGACDLLQLASMFSSQRSEFVNTMRRGWPIRFDDPYFISGDRDKIRAETPFELLGWTRDDVEQFDKALCSSEVIISSLFAATGWTYFETWNGVRRQIEPSTVNRMLKEYGVYFIRTFNHVRLNHQARFDLVRDALDRMIREAPPGAVHITLSAGTRAFSPLTADVSNILSAYGAPTKQDLLALRLAYNDFLRQYCAKRPQCIFVDLDDLVGVEDLAGVEADLGRALPDHYSRQAYVAIARELKLRVQAADSKTRPTSEKPKPEKLKSETISEKLSRFRPRLLSSR